MLMTSNYIKTESNLEFQMKKGTSKNMNNNANYEISASNAFTINTNQISNLLKSNSSNKYHNLKEKENIMNQNLEIKSENSLYLKSYKDSIKEEITENIHHFTNISDDKLNAYYKQKSKDISNKKSLSSNNISKNFESNNVISNKSDLTIEEESNILINNKN